MNCDVGTHNEANRVRWLEQQLRRLPAGQRILDAGAGEQRYRPFCQHLRDVAQDFAQYTPDPSGSGLQMGKWDYGTLDIISDIIAIPEPDASFDAVLCAEVLEHVPHPLLAIKEFARLLRPGGTLLLTAPFASLTHFAPHFYATGFGSSYYHTHLPAHGFEIVEMQTNGNWFEYLAQEIRRISQVSVRYCAVQPTAADKECMKGVLEFLQQCSGADTGSSELSCFGYHVKAVKN